MDPEQKTSSSQAALMVRPAEPTEKVIKKEFIEYTQPAQFQIKNNNPLEILLVDSSEDR